MLGWSSKSNAAAHALTRTLANRRGLVFPFATPQHEHHPAPPSDNTHRSAYAPFACTRCVHAIHAAQESIEEEDTYHQLDLLGRAPVGVGGCRVVGFALAAGIHDWRAPEWVDWNDICAATAVRGLRTVCDRGVRRVRVDVTFTNSRPWPAARNTTLAM